MSGISAVIITKNEENNIEKCIESVLWCDEIVVIDSGSTDKTIEILNKYPVKLIESLWLGFGRTKQLAVENSKGEWVFSIDADERITKELKGEILKIISSPITCSGYRVKRKSFYLGEEINFSGWQNDYPLRLFLRNRGKFNDKAVHESVIISDDNVGRIEAPILHNTFPNLNTHIRKMNLYTDISSRDPSKKTKKATLPGSVIRGVLKFVKMYFLKQGFRDGKVGFILAFVSGFGVSLKYFKIWSVLKGKAIAE